MKFRDPKTGEVFEDIDTAIWNKCRRRDPCDTNCPLFKLRKHIACRDYVISHAELIGSCTGGKAGEQAKTLLVGICERDDPKLPQPCKEV